MFLDTTTSASSTMVSAPRLHPASQGLHTGPASCSCAHAAATQLVPILPTLVSAKPASALHVHVKLPTVSMHRALLSQLSVFKVHSSTSEQIKPVPA
eukprot:1335126-Rhodomonas_salina.2